MIRRLQQQDELAYEDFQKAASLGGVFARHQCTQLNPYAKLCNQMLQDAFEKLQGTPFKWSRNYLQSGTFVEVWHLSTRFPLWNFFIKLLWHNLVQYEPCSAVLHLSCQTNWCLEFECLGIWNVSTNPFHQLHICWILSGTCVYPVLLMESFSLSFPMLNRYCS